MSGIISVCAKQLSFTYYLKVQTNLNTLKRKGDSASVEETKKYKCFYVLDDLIFQTRAYVNKPSVVQHPSGGGFI